MTDQDATPSAPHQGDFNLPYKPHFGVHCEQCGAACLTELTPEQLAIARRDPSAALRSLSAEDQKECAEFYALHEKMGHSPEPVLMELAPLPRS
jgi:hypothetical protein